MSKYRKLFIALAGVVAQAVQLGLLPEDANSYAAVILATLTAVLVFLVPNETE